MGIERMSDKDSFITVFLVFFFSFLLRFICMQLLPGSTYHLTMQTTYPYPPQETSIHVVN